MHPADVADLVLDQYQRLVDRLSELREMGAGELTLEGDHHIYLQLDHTGYKTEALALPTGLHAAGDRGVLLRNWNVPVLGTGTSTVLVLCVDAEQYNRVPPRVELLNTERQSMPLAEWPAGRKRGGIVEEHPNLGRPFFCRPGTYGYHTHPAHVDDPWAKHREGLNLDEFVVRLVADLHHDYISRR